MPAASADADEDGDDGGWRGAKRGEACAGRGRRNDAYPVRPDIGPHRGRAVRRAGRNAGQGPDAAPYKTRALAAGLRAAKQKAQVAQLVEHVTENHGVGGSIPPLGTTKHFILEKSDC